MPRFMRIPGTDRFDGMVSFICVSQCISEVQPFRANQALHEDSAGRE